MLINDILDLSKIESGTVVLDVGELRFADLYSYVDRTFRHVAESKEVEFSVKLDGNLPRSLTTDSKRLQQVIKNLLSNAFKFTHHGEVCLRVREARDGWHPDNESLNAADCVLAISVSDTGIGIPMEKQQIIFEAFQQADGSTSRKYGGTGLGLAISREIARLLGGEIGLSSTPGVGSTFTLYLPQSFAPQKTARRAQSRRSEAARQSTSPGDSAGTTMSRESSRADASRAARPTPQPSKSMPVAHLPLDDDASAAEEEIVDDRRSIQTGDHVLLIVDNDVQFSKFVLERARQVGFKGLMTASGAQALALVSEYSPHAVILDISLPDVEGWRVLRRLKHDLSMRHIPVFVVSTVDHPERGLQLGAQGVLAKPIQTAQRLDQFLEQILEIVRRTERNVLVVEPDQSRANELVGLLAPLDSSEGRVLTAPTGAAALELLRSNEIDCVVLTTQLPDMRLASLAAEISAEPFASGPPAMVLYTQRDMPAEELDRWKKLAGEFNLRHVDSPGALVDQVAFSLCRPVAKLPEPQRKLVQEACNPAPKLARKKVLIVDDDIRNIFALTSVLERYDIVTVSAETGRDAINLLQAATDVDIVLMDIMMPEMDGIDTMRAIRQINRFKALPIIAVTAKAMKGDRDKCIEAGAWDYLSKPVDSDQMLSALNAWLTE